LWVAAAGSVPRHAISAYKQQTTYENEAGQININTNMQQACSPPATSAAVAAALIVVSNPFFAGAFFTTGGFVAGFFGRCLGIGDVFATGRIGGVDGAPATGPTAAACPRLMM
jgi:hypothetical protein